MVRLDEAALTAYAERATKAAGTLGRVIGGVVSVGVLGSVGVGAWAAYQGVSDAVQTVGGIAAGGGFDMWSFADSELLPGDGAISEVVLIVDGAQRERLIYADLGATDPVRWDVSLADLLPADASVASYERIVATTDQVLFTFGERVLAFDRHSGAPLYQVQLSDTLMNTCVECLRVVNGDRVAALSSDGVLQVWNAADGKGGWKVRLPGEAPRQLLVVAGDPAVIVAHPEADGTRVTRFTVYSAENGTAVHEQQPSCPNGPWTRYAHPYDRLVELPDGGYVWLGDCPQRWSPGAEQPDWIVGGDLLDTTVDLPTFQPGRTLVADDVLVSATTRGLAVIDLGSGAIVEIPRNEVSDLTPLAVVDDVLVVTEKSRRGSQRWQLTGVDLADPAGQADDPAWRVTLTGSPGDDGFITSDEWLVGVVPAGVAVVDLDVDADVLSTRIVDPASGTAGPTHTLDLGDLMFAELVGWRDGRLLLGANHRLYAVDPATATVSAEAP